MLRDSLVIGIDFGTDSVRSVIVRTDSGEEIASDVYRYPRWREGLYCDPGANRFRQHPLDYIEGLEQTVISCIKKSGPSAAKFIKGISADTTGSTPVAVDEAGVPLALQPAFAENPNAMFVLWKDHTAVKEASEINEHAKKYRTDYLKYVGGVYSSEWFWAKLLHVLREDEAVRQACYSWVEHCDWIPFLLTGGKHVAEMKRSRCAAGHKALWSAPSPPAPPLSPPAGGDERGSWGLPPNDFFASLDPLLNCFTQRLYTDTYTSDQPAGTLSKAWAERLGLTTDVVVGTGAFDAHMGAAGGQIEPYYLSKVMGTSTCDMLVAPMEDMENKLVKGICGQVPGSVIPGMMGMEAGQSAFGDVYAWFGKLLQWPLENLLLRSSLINKETAAKLKNEINDKILYELSIAANEIIFTEQSELALDWLNGRRTPFANQELKAGIIGLNLASDAPAIFRALAEATCFGAKKIVDCFTEQGVPVKGLIGSGGVARKSPFIMQMMADVMDMPIRIHRSEQTCAMGAAMFAATAAGIYPKVEEAMAAMGQGFDKEYFPDKNKSDIYHKRYERYQKLGECVESLSV
ncbi:MAG: ribulokinase [Chitinophagaceae bacterium]|nr:MAG: ribulokinase [Chitinophagaceae bacterium]